MIDRITELLGKSVAVLAAAANGSPLITTCTVMLYWVFFTILEASVEAMIFGERFEHWLDPIFVCCFIAYSAYSVWGCAVYNSSRGK